MLFSLFVGALKEISLDFREWRLRYLGRSSLVTFLLEQVRFRFVGVHDVWRYRVVDKLKEISHYVGRSHWKS